MGKICSKCDLSFTPIGRCDKICQLCRAKRWSISRARTRISRLKAKMFNHEPQTKPEVVLR